ncbi:MAG TPA: type II secretion system protein GspM [Longimicrobiales bacterium]|nr:type II secretion system protein GspM [Longimicrobiales bacterium]
MTSFSRLLDAILLRTLAPRDRRAVLIGLAVLAPALLWIGVVRPYREALSDLDARVASERALLEREEALLAAAPELPSRATAARERAAGATQRLVSAANVPLAEAEVTAFLQDVALLSRVLLQEVSSVEAPRGDEEHELGSIRPLRLALRGESDLEGVLTFLHRLETGPLLLRIAELSIEPTPQRDDNARMDGAVQVNLVLHAFVPAGTGIPSNNEEGSS